MRTSFQTVILVIVFTLISAVSSAASPPFTTPTGQRPSLTITTLLKSTTATTGTSVIPPTSTPALASPTTSAGEDPGKESSYGNATNTRNPALISCPPPLIPNSLQLSSSSCEGQCCIPCPASSVFYEPGKLRTIYMLTSIIRAISATACGFMSICYIILPSRRKHPHLIVLIFTVLLVPWEGIGTIWLYQKDDLLCKNVYEIATMSNSWLCGLQGVALVYIIWVVLCLALLLIANLHLLTVYQSLVVESHLTKLIVLTFFLPLSAVIPVVVSKKIENPGFGSVCFVSSDVASPLFFYPLSVVVCIAAILHLGTIIFMIKTSIKANTVSLNDSASYDFSDSQSSKTIFAGRRRLQTARDISRLLKQQWRPGLFALFILAVDMVYSLFYFTAAKKLAIVKPTTPWFTQWTKCLEGQAMISIQAGRLSLTPTADQLIIAGEAAQAACASIAGPYVPSFPWAALAEVMPAILGTIIGLIFGTKVELWQDLRTQLFGNRNSAILTTDGNTKGDRELNLSQAHEHPLDEQYQTKQQRTTKDNDFYSGGLGSDQGFYNSHDILAQSVVHYDNDKLESSMPSSPTTPTSPSPAAGTFRSSLRKGSITIDTIHRPSIGQDIQTPKSMKMTQERAQLVAEGAEPWPAWPSSILHTSRYPNTELESFYSAIPIITSNGIINTTPINAPTQPPSSTERRPSFAMRIQEEKPAADANSATQCQTSASRGFYNSEDLTAGPILQALSRKQSLKTQEMSRQLKQQQQKVQVSTKPPQLEVTIPLRTNSRRDRQVQFQIESEPSQQQLTRTDSILRSPTSPKSANIPTTSPPVPRKSGRRYS